MDIQRGNTTIKRTPARGTADTIELLTQVTVQVHIYARKLIPALTIINMMIFIVIFALPMTEKIETVYIIFLIMMMCILQGITIYNLVAFDGLIRDGDVYYSQISDELEWYHKSEYSSDADPHKQRRVTQGRLIMRQFINETSLPIVRGRLGVLLYFIANLGFFLYIIYAIRLSYAHS